MGDKLVSTSLAVLVLSAGLALHCTSDGDLASKSTAIEYGALDALERAVVREALEACDLPAHASLQEYLYLQEDEASRPTVEQTIDNYCPTNGVGVCDWTTDSEPKRICLLRTTMCLAEHFHQAAADASSPHSFNARVRMYDAARYFYVTSAHLVRTDVRSVPPCVVYHPPQYAFVEYEAAVLAAATEGLIDVAAAQATMIAGAADAMRGKVTDLRELQAEVYGIRELAVGETPASYRAAAMRLAGMRFGVNNAYECASHGGPYQDPAWTVLGDPEASPGSLPELQNGLHGCGYAATVDSRRPEVRRAVAMVRANGILSAAEQAARAGVASIDELVVTEPDIRDRLTTMSHTYATLRRSS